MDFGGFNWILITIIGAVVLGAVILWASIRNRTSRGTQEDTEQATHRLYEEEDRAHRGEDEDVP